MRLLVVLTLVATPSFAQSAVSRIPPDATVELTTLGLIQSRLQGRMQALDSTGIRFTVTRIGSAAYIPWTNVGSLKWSAGRSRPRGTFDGVIVGLLLGGSMYLNSQPWNVPTVAQKENVRRIAVSAAGILVATTVVGTTIGSHRWRNVPVPSGAGGDVALEFHPNDDVRVESTSGRFAGRGAVASDSLRVVTTSGPMTFAWRSVGDLQIRGGKRRERGVLIGAGIALLAGTLAETFVNFTTGERVAHLVGGGIIGYRFLSPEGWTSLPQPRR